MVLGEFSTSKQQSSREKATSSVRRPVASPAKSPSLAIEAAEMEAKLLELRKAMEQERAKREGKGADGSYWRSGAAAGHLRSGVRSKTGTPLPPVQQQAGNGESVTANVQRWTADMDARPVQPSISTAAAGRISAPTSRPDSGGQALSHRPGQLVPPRHVLPRVDNPPQGHVVRPFHDQPNDSTTGNLADGVFNEADSHGSFLDALNEWRAANRGDKQQEASVSQQAQQQQQQLRPRPSLPQPSQQGQEASSMQTESRVTPRPGSAGKPVTYFNRLLLNSASRQAGHAASSSTAPALEGGTGPSSSGLTRRSSHILPPLTSPSGSSSQLHSASQLHFQPHSSSQVYAVETAMTSPAQSMAGTASRHRGLDILEELEALERKQHSLMQQYDSDDEWAALLSPHGQAGRRKQQQEQLVVTTQQGMVGLTKGVRLPDAILLPEVDSDEEAGQ